MSWEQILGFFTMWPSPLTTIALWSKGGVPLWQTVFYVSFLTSISLSLTYFGTGWLERWIIKRDWIKRKTVEKWKNWQKQQNNNFQINGFGEKLSNKIKKWLIPQKSWRILFWGFVPFVPFLPTIVIIVTRLMEIKRGFLFLIIGNVARNIIICYSIYKGIDFLY